uniref:CSD domain-containing protein n=1 Tax=Craspedostauros australis TaxID=1486917 RepID=A0A7R9WTL0_9STRA|mmetsp:Transcript_17852/g.49499  ORF Transcript_17852/g.49499 Transcript_17852/m.49499 type:complete len:192 (+) Transcript_17852:95-670(+)
MFHLACRTVRRSAQIQAPLAQARLLPQWTASSSCAMRSLSSSTEEYTGIVKFYMRNKAYGFILPDDQELGDVFVHCSSVVCDVPTEESNVRPFLVRNERVRFGITDKEGHAQKYATNVRFEDGSIVPIYRQNYAKSMRKDVACALGETVLEMADLSDEELAAQVRTGIEVAQAKIEEGIEMEKTGQPLQQW